MSTNDEVSGIFDAISAEQTAHDPVEETNTESESQETAPSDEDQTQTEPTEETDAHTQTEQTEQTDQTNTSETNTDTNTETSETNTETQTEDIDWQANLPPAPPEYQGPQPEYGEDGQITNMSPQEFVNYMTEQATYRARQEGYQHTVEMAAMDAAEKILPEMKDNKTVAQMVQDIRIASVLNGEQISTYDAAKRVREALGIAPEKLSAAKAEGANNAKASIQVQKNAALETGSSRKASDTTDKISELQNRVRRGDDEAFVDILNMWEEEGKL